MMCAIETMKLIVYSLLCYYLQRLVILNKTEKFQNVEKSISVLILFPAKDGVRFWFHDIFSWHFVCLSVSLFVCVFACFVFSSARILNSSSSLSKNFSA